MKDQISAVELANTSQSGEGEKADISEETKRHETISDECNLTQGRISRPAVKTSLIEACVTYYKGSMGSGVLAAPYTLSQGGWGLGLIMFITVPTLIIITTLKLVQMVDEEINKPGLGFSAVARALGGEKSINWMKSMLIMLQWGCCASYILFFMQFIEYAVFDSLTISFTHQLIYLFIAFCLLLPMTLINNVAMFARLNFLSSTFTVITLIAIALFSIDNLTHGAQESQIENKFNLRYLPLQAGVSLFGFEGIGLIFSIKGSMQDERQFPKVVKYIGAWIIIQNLSIALLSSFAFGVSTQQIVLLSLKRTWLSSFVQIMYAVALLISFPLQLLPAFQMMEGFTLIRNCVHMNVQGYILRRTIIRIVQVIMIAVLAISIPQFAVLLSFIGGLAAAALQFAFPLWAYWQNRIGKEPKWQSIIFISLCVIGILLGATATVDSIVITSQG